MAGLTALGVNRKAFLGGKANLKKISATGFIRQPRNSTFGLIKNVKIVLICITKMFIKIFFKKMSISGEIFMPITAFLIFIKKLPE